MSKMIREKFDVVTPKDITNALKDLLGDTLQNMLNSEFDEHMGYAKYDQIEKKDNYRSGSSKMKVKTAQGQIKLEIPRDRNASFDTSIIEKQS